MGALAPWVAVLAQMVTPWTAQYSLRTIFSKDCNEGPFEHRYNVRVIVDRDEDHPFVVLCFVLMPPPNRHECNADLESLDVASCEHGLYHCTSVGVQICTPGWQIERQTICCFNLGMQSLKSWAVTDPKCECVEVLVKCLSLVLRN